MSSQNSNSSVKISIQKAHFVTKDNSKLVIFRFFYPELYNNSDVRKVEYNMTLIETLKEEDKNLTFVQVSYGYLPLVRCKLSTFNFQIWKIIALNLSQNGVLT